MRVEKYNVQGGGLHKYWYSAQGWGLRKYSAQGWILQKVSGMRFAKIQYKWTRAAKIQCAGMRAAKIQCTLDLHYFSFARAHQRPSDTPGNDCWWLREKMDAARGIKQLVQSLIFLSITLLPKVCTSYKYMSPPPTVAPSEKCRVTCSTLGLQSAHICRKDYKENLKL